MKHITLRHKIKCLKIINQSLQLSGLVGVSGGIQLSLVMGLQKHREYCFTVHV